MNNENTENYNTYTNDYNTYTDDYNTYNQTGENIDEYYSNLAFFFICTIFCTYTIICCKQIFNYTYKNYKTNKSLSEGRYVNETNLSICSICLEEYDNDNIISKLNCNHIFHKECIKEWFQKNNNCPNCRKIII